jgi:hypothetical protein
LLAKNAVLLAKVINHLQLTLVHPSGYGDQHELKVDPVFGPYDSLEPRSEASGVHSAHDPAAI